MRKIIFLLALVTVAIVSVTTLSAPAHAQWLKYKTPGIPRTVDGKPDLSAPAPRTADGKPDLSGLWKSDNAGLEATNKAVESIKPQPWAAALAKKREEDLFKDTFSVLCLPPGPFVSMGVGKVVQTPDLLLMLFGGTVYREIHLDGRELPKDPNPDWMGYSVGHWEGDTLVVESTGFNDRSWIDGAGHPHTEALHITERLRRPNFGHLEMQKTLVAPEAFAGSWTVPFKFELDADTEDLEYVCNENERDRSHLTGKASDVKAIRVAPGILAKYVGSYELTLPDSGRILNLTISLDADRLMAGGLGISTPLKPISETDFTASFGGIKFVTGDTGEVSYLLLQAVEGDLKGVRKGGAAPDTKK
jgi:hypothetical protein